jgi:hypothetical protein
MFAVVRSMGEMGACRNAGGVPCSGCGMAHDRHTAAGKATMTVGYCSNDGGVSHGLPHATREGKPPSQMH